MRAFGWISVIGLLLTGVVAGIFQLSVPALEGERRLPGLEAPVEVVHDVHGIPLITAGSALDAYRALGYLHARDRLWQMEFGRRVAQGRLAEILGERAVATDRFLRTLGLYRWSSMAMDDLDPETLEALQAYSDGVNQYIGESWSLAPEFWLLWHRPEPWRPVDSAVWTKLMALDLAENWRSEFVRARLKADLGETILEDLWPPVDSNVPFTVAGGAASSRAQERIKGSNAWAVGGERSQGGAALLANDPHLAMRIPTLWYLASIETPELQFKGATIAGMPVPVLGRNRNLAWGFTNTGADQQDLVIEKVADAEGRHYRRSSRDLPFAMREEVIRVRFGHDRRMLVRSTPDGPVISDAIPAARDFLAADEVLTLVWPALGDGDTTIQAGFRMATAADIGSFREAFRDFKAPMQNVMVASGNGEIGFFVAGLAPIREPGSGWLPASSDAFVPWRGFVPFDELPARFDPPGDLLFNANNHLVGDAYAHDLGRDWDGGFRARRLEALLLGKPRLDTETMRRIQTDVHSNLAADFLPHLLEAISNRAEFREIHELLEGWDLRADADSAAMLVFAAWYDELADVIYADELGRALPIYRGIRATFTRSTLEDGQEWCDDRRTLGREDCSRMLRLALRRALAVLRSAHGEDLATWRWGDAHRFRPSHMPFSQMPLISRLFALDRPASGDSTSLNVAHYRAQPSAVFEITQGPGYRGLYDLARPHHAAVVIAGGQSGHPFSRHYDDLVDKWLSGDLVDLAKREPGKRLLLRP